MTNTIDLNEVDTSLYDCLDLDNPRSFFLFAGAGSGKTRSLVNVLMKVKKEKGLTLKTQRQRIAVITYTNAACDEIMDRLEQDSLFFVSTIHSFVWDLIKPYQNDIRKWLYNDIHEKIIRLEEEIDKGRSGTKAAIDRQNRLESLNRRLVNLPQITSFSYNPNGDNRSRESLNHTEVIYIAASFLQSKVLMQKILIKKFPVLLIDESQDTKKELLDAFFQVQSQNKTKFSLGLFGDTMQRIYSDGKQGLGENLPDDWVTPEKLINYRCPKRIVSLINKIRSTADDKQQQSYEEKEEGVARLFIVGSTDKSKTDIENNIASKMAEITGDNLWVGAEANVKSLTLEHHMAANRLNFLPLFQPLYSYERITTSLLAGDLSELRLFTEQVLPLIEAKKEGDEFQVAFIVKKYSPLLDVDVLKGEKDQRKQLHKASNAVKKLYSLWDKGEPKLIDIVSVIAETGLFRLPDNFEVIVKRNDSEISAENEQEQINDSISVWDEVLECSFDQVAAYKEYISGEGKFGTHQGVKGLQFERVMVIIDDDEARGFLFSYGKIFGDKELTKRDLDNIAQGKETGVDRTMRLFYVSCSRAEKSLAVVAYTKNPQVVKQHVIDQQWFSENEIELI